MSIYIYIPLPLGGVYFGTYQYKLLFDHLILQILNQVYFQYRSFPSLKLRLAGKHDMYSL